MANNTVSVIRLNEKLEEYDGVKYVVNSVLFKCEVYGPEAFLNKIPQLLEQIATNHYGRQIHSALGALNKPIKIVYTRIHQP